MNPIVLIYSKQGCGKCEAAKDKLRKMGLAYEEHTLAYHTEIHDGWREDGSTDLRAWCEAQDGGTPHALPTIEIIIDGKTEWHNYSGAMRRLKEMGYKACVGE